MILTSNILLDICMRINWVSGVGHLLTQQQLPLRISLTPMNPGRQQLDCVSMRFLWSFQNFYSSHSTLLMFEFSNSRSYDSRIIRHKNNKTIASIAKANQDWQLLRLHEPSPIVLIYKVSFHRRSVYNCVPSLEEFPHCIWIVSQRFTLQFHQRLHHRF